MALIILVPIIISAQNIGRIFDAQTRKNQIFKAQEIRPTVKKIIGLEKFNHEEKSKLIRGDTISRTEKSWYAYTSIQLIKNYAIKTVDEDRAVIMVNKNIIKNINGNIFLLILIFFIIIIAIAIISSFFIKIKLILVYGLMAVISVLFFTIIPIGILLLFLGAIAMVVLTPLSRQTNSAKIKIIYLYIPVMWGWIMAKQLWAMENIGISKLSTDSLLVWPQIFLFFLMLYALKKINNKYYNKSA